MQRCGAVPPDSALTSSYKLHPLGVCHAACRKDSGPGNAARQDGPASAPAADAQQSIGATAGTNAGNAKQAAAQLPQRPPLAAAGSGHVQPKIKAAPAMQALNAATAAHTTAAATGPCSGGLYLDWVRLMPVGLSEAETHEVAHLLACSGAVRELSLSPCVTHVLVGSEAPSAELVAVRDHWLAWRDMVQVVRLEWLRRCVDVRACIDAAATSDTSLVFPITAIPATRGPSLLMVSRPAEARWMLGVCALNALTGRCLP